MIRGNVLRVYKRARDREIVFDIHSTSHDIKERDELGDQNTVNFVYKASAYKAHFAYKAGNLESRFRSFFI